MNYKKLLDKLENDTSVADLEQYLSGEKKFTLRMTTVEHRKELLEIIIPKLVTEMKKDNEIMAVALIKSPLMRLGFVRCTQKKIKLQELKYTDTEQEKKQKHSFNIYHVTEAMREIINQMGKDTRSEILKRQFARYRTHVKAGHYETDDF
jgi:hypothetical protein